MREQEPYRWNPPPAFCFMDECRSRLDWESNPFICTFPGWKVPKITAVHDFYLKSSLRLKNFNFHPTHTNFSSHLRSDFLNVNLCNAGNRKESMNWQSFRNPLQLCRGVAIVLSQLHNHGDPRYTHSGMTCKFWTSENTCHSRLLPGIHNISLLLRTAGEGAGWGYLKLLFLNI